MPNFLRKTLPSFFFAPDSTGWLALLRIGLGLEVVVYCLSLRGDWNHLLAGHGRGLISRELAEATLGDEGVLIPRLSWVVNLGSHLGLGEDVVLSIAWFCLIGAGLFLLAGLFSRPAALAAWFLHLAAVKSLSLMAYGVDNFTTLGLFYLMIAPLPDQYSIDHLVRRRPLRDPTWSGFHRRLLQLNLCLAYFFSGLMKILGSGWWDGGSLWRALTRAPFNHVPPELLIRFSPLLPAAGLFVCLLELGYPVLIWPKKTRGAWLALTLMMHAGIAVTMGLYLFAMIMVVLNVAAFAPEFLLRNGGEIAAKGTAARQLT